MLFEDEEKCISHLNDINKLVFQSNDSTTIGCNGTFDKVICWEAVKADTTVLVQCPNIKGVFDPNKLLEKYCMADGHWYGSNITQRYSGFTNFETCYTEIALKELNKIKQDQNTGLVYHVASYIELSGLILSFISICLSLFIFFYHKSLRNRRTKIHLNLFVAILFQSILRIVFFIDRFIYKQKNKEQTDQISFESQLMVYNKSICPILTALVEYFQLCNFMWMLSEGIYLNILLTYSVFNETNQKAIIFFYVIGWGLPALITIGWTLTLYYSIGIDDVCWSGFYDRASYWIIQGPVLISLIINFCCLANVIRILAIKLKLNNQNSDVEQIKKSAKAAVLLLPLLGITHMFEVYHDEPKNWIINLIFSIINSFLVFYQGVFLSILYCFTNNEVKDTVKRHWCIKIKSFNSNSKSKKRQKK